MKTTSVKGGHHQLTANSRKFPVTVLSKLQPRLTEGSSGPELSAAKIAANREVYRVQLAAARTPERARLEWDRVRLKHLDLLGDLALTVTKADLGSKKGIFYRLRVGPLPSEGSARELCKKLSQRKMSCLVIKPGR